MWQPYKLPVSRAYPHFNAAPLARSLRDRAIDYEHIEALGGRRGRSHAIPPDTNAFWDNQSFHNYADFAMTDEFRAGFERLVELGHARRCAVMCSEALWWRCHRRIITDYLLAAGNDVFHIVSSDVPEPARMTQEAELAAGGVLAYPARQQGLAL